MDSQSKFSNAPLYSMIPSSSCHDESIHSHGRICSLSSSMQYPHLRVFRLSWYKQSLPFLHNSAKLLKCGNAIAYLFFNVMSSQFIVSVSLYHQLPLYFRE